MGIDHVLELVVRPLQNSSGSFLVDVGASFAIAIILVLTAANSLTSVELVAACIDVAAEGVARA